LITKAGSDSGACFLRLNWNLRFLESASGSHPDAARGRTLV
jgi:hypothetical protein